jgi:hypothetical protein
MVPAIALVLAAIFGGVDQYLGSFSAHPWMADVSLLSAPWLAIAFLAGLTQTSARRSAALGLACTAAALAGYAVMTLSPVENAHFTTAGLAGFISSERFVLVGGVVTGPLFGWFGQQWRTRRAWAGALATALAICLEPLVTVPAPAYHHVRSHTVAAAEAAVGLLAVAYVVLSAVRARSTR